MLVLYLCIWEANTDHDLAGNEDNSFDHNWYWNLLLISKIDGRLCRLLVAPNKELCDVIVSRSLPVKLVILLNTFLHLFQFCFEVVIGAILFLENLECLEA